MKYPRGQRIIRTIQSMVQHKMKIEPASPNQCQTIRKRNPEFNYFWVNQRLILIHDTLTGNQGTWQNIQRMFGENNNFKFKLQLLSADTFGVGFVLDGICHHFFAKQNSHEIKVTVRFPHDHSLEQGLFLFFDLFVMKPDELTVCTLHAEILNQNVT